MRITIGQIKKQVTTMQYMASLNKIVENILQYDGSEDCPFPKAHRKALTGLFKRSSVVQHTVFKVTGHARKPIAVEDGRSTFVMLIAISFCADCHVVAQTPMLIAVTLVFHLTSFARVLLAGQRMDAGTKKRAVRGQYNDRVHEQIVGYGCEHGV
jgi:hypothetical protein